MICDGGYFLQRGSQIPSMVLVCAPARTGEREQTLQRRVFPSSSHALLPPCVTIYLLTFIYWVSVSTFAAHRRVEKADMLSPDTVHVLKWVQFWTQRFQPESFAPPVGHMENYIYIFFLPHKYCMKMISISLITWIKYFHTSGYFTIRVAKQYAVQ